MMALEATLAKPLPSKNITSLEQRMASLKAQLAAKKAELAKDEKEIKLFTLQKALAEKKLDLEKLSSEEKSMILKMDAADKKDQAELDTIAKSTSKADHDLKKSQSILKMLRKKTHRKYLQVKAVKKAELAELEAAITEIKKGDAKALQVIATNMQKELDAVA